MLSCLFCVVGLAIRWLKHSSLEAVLADKDGVFVILASQTLRCMISQKLGASHFKLVCRENVANEFRHFKGAVSLFARDIFVLGFKKWARDMVAALPLLTLQSLFCNARCTIKTHKPAGSVEARLLHAAPSGNGGLKHLSMVLHKWLHAQVVALPNVCSRSGALRVLWERLATYLLIVCLQKSM